MDTCFWPYRCLTRPVLTGLTFNLFKKDFGVCFWKCSLMVAHSFGFGILGRGGRGGTEGQVALSLFQTFRL